MDVDSIIDSIDDESGVIHNLPPLRSVVARKSEFGRLLDFLTTNDSWEDENEVSHPAPAIMVVSGPRGFGKSTLTLQAAYKAIDYHDFKTIIWFDKKRFLELLHSDPLISPTSYVSAGDANSARRFLANQEDYQKLQDLLEFALAQTDGELNLPESRPFIRRFLREVQPYLLVIDDIDEDFHARTPQICRELMRVRAPNKVILTSRTPNLPFGREVDVRPLKLGLLNLYQVDHLVRCECDQDKLARQYWVNENLDQTIQWVWENLGGLPDVIVHVFKKAQEESKPLEYSTYWPGILREFTLNYIQGGSDNTAEEIFQNLSPTEKYLLSTLAWSATGESRSRKNLLKLLAIHEKHPQWHDYSDAITSLYSKRFLGYEVESAISDELYQLHPFMRGVIQEKLENYWNGDFQRERTSRLVEFFRHYSQSDDGLSFLADFLDQGLTALSWLADQEEWCEVLTFGEALVDVLLWSDRRGRDSDLMEACNRIITAAEATDNGNAEAQYRILLLHYARANGASDLYQKQNHALIKFRDVYGELEEDVRNSLAPVYLHLALRNNDVEEARHWLDRTNGAEEMAHQARLELADYYYGSNNYQEALKEAKTVKDLRQTRQSYSEVDVQVHQLLGNTHFKLGQRDYSIAAFTEAALIAKSINRPDLANEYHKAADFIRMSSTPAPLDNIGLPNRTLYWAGFDNKTICPLCKEQIHTVAEGDRQTWACASCQTKFHQDCIIELGISHCPICQKPTPDFDRPTQP